VRCRQPTEEPSGAVRGDCAELHHQADGVHDDAGFLDSACFEAVDHDAADLDWLAGEITGCRTRQKPGTLLVLEDRLSASSVPETVGRRPVWRKAHGHSGEAQK